MASKSPRRKEILEKSGLIFEVMPSNIEEKVERFEGVKNFVITLARMKGWDISKKVDKAIVLASDTVVVINNRILEKPEDEDEAIKMLRELSGNEHNVYTSLFVHDKYLDTVSEGYVKTKVKFYPLDEGDIEGYVKTKEPMDKAGAYGIQGYGAKFIENINGCYYSVMGFPISLFYQKIKELGYYIG